MREYRVVCADGYSGFAVESLDEAKALLIAAPTYHHGDCGPHRIEYADWRDLSADTTGGGETDG
jgi:hypothetical protein